MWDQAEQHPLRCPFNSSLIAHKKNIKLALVLFPSGLMAQIGNVNRCLLMISLWKGSLPGSGSLPDLPGAVSQP